MERRFVTVDVFAERQFGGNPLAVVLDAEGLTSEQMQNIAMEFNLSETTFVLPPRDPQHTAEVRIFTPRAEIPFAGHPNVGTAFVLANERGLSAEDVLRFEEKAGLVELELKRDRAAIVGAELAAPQTLSVGDEVSPETVAAACGLSVQDISMKRHPPTIASAGLPWILAALESRETLRKAAPRADVFASQLPPERAAGIQLYVPVDDDGVHIQSRVFAPLFGVPEDPATGSANVALIGFLASLEPEDELVLSKTIAQGVEMGRPSLLNARAKKAKGKITRTWIGGRCAMVMEGHLRLV